MHVQIARDQRQHPHAPDRGPPDPRVRNHRAPASANSPVSTHWLMGALPLGHQLFAYIAPLRAHGWLDNLAIRIVGQAQSELIQGSTGSDGIRMADAEVLLEALPPVGLRPAERFPL